MPVYNQVHDDYDGQVTMIRRLLSRIANRAINLSDLVYISLRNVRISYDHFWGKYSFPLVRPCGLQ